MCSSVSAKQKANRAKIFRQDPAGRLRKISEKFFFDEVLHSDVLGCTYSLQAVAVHKGRFGHGHYFAFVRDSEDQWLLVNDGATPVLVPFARVQGSHAYLLVFQLQGAP